MGVITRHIKYAQAWISPIPKTGKRHKICLILLLSGVLLYKVLEERHSGMSVMAVSGNSIVTSIRKCDAYDVVITFSQGAFVGREGERKQEPLCHFHMVTSFLRKWEDLYSFFLFIFVSTTALPYAVLSLLFLCCVVFHVYLDFFNSLISLCPYNFSPCHPHLHIHYSFLFKLCIHFFLLSVKPFTKELVSNPEVCSVCLAIYRKCW